MPCMELALTMNGPSNMATARVNNRKMPSSEPPNLNCNLVPTKTSMALTPMFVSSIWVLIRWYMPRIKYDWQTTIVKNLVEKFVKDGDSWAKARRGYEMTLYLQMRSVSMMANWIGGSHVNRDKKGDEGNRAPLEVVDVQKQRDALKFVIDHAFVDEAFGLTPELLSRMGVDKWLDGDGFLRALREDADWPVHDRIAGIQSACLTMLMNPTTLRRVYDNEFRTSSDKDALTLPELLSTISDSIWKEIHADIGEKHTARKPMISSLRRVLQREHLKRLIDLSMPGAGNSAAYKPIANLALVDLKEIGEKCSKILKADEGRLDPYTKAHLSQAESEIKRVLAAQYIYNANDIGGSGFPGFLFFKEPQKPAEE